jgi:5-methyltetrahydrofolate--homocysteine methyltransferase
MPEILKRLKNGEVLVADGAIGTMLMQRGLRPGSCPESVNLSQPDLLLQIAQLYCDAGADIVTTNTFGGSPIRLSQEKLDDRTEEINQSAVGAVRKAVGRRAYVSGSCGPCGRLLKPYGDADPADVRRSFRRQILSLVDAGIDILCIETMTDLAEAKLAIEAAREIAANLPIIATMTFDRTKRGFYTIMGNSLHDAAKGLESAGANIIGSNCGNGCRNMVELARELRKGTRLPLIIQPNAGLPERFKDRLIYRETPEFMTEAAKELIDIGVSVIGGCCGTTPEHIRAFRRLVDSRTVST